MGFRVAYGAGSHVGTVRSVNEDAVLADPPVFVIADGMGGHAAGEVAAGLTVDAFRRFNGASAVDVGSVAAAVRAANDDVRHRASQVLAEQGMGTTAVGLVVARDGGDEVLVAFNVGDSRIYRLRAELEQISTDHSVVAEKVAAGEITAAEAAVDRERNVITRAIGIEESVDVDSWTLRPATGDRFLLCSDGLTDELTDERLAEILRAEQDPQRAVDELLSAALDAGARDNVSVLVIDVVEVDPQVATQVDDTNPRGVTVDDDTNPTRRARSVPGVDADDLPSGSTPR